jgi:hypothetical protein
MESPAIARLRGAGLSEAEIQLLSERAELLVAGLQALAALDPELPEPALTWRPVEGDEE